METDSSAAVGAAVRPHKPSAFSRPSPVVPGLPAGVRLLRSCLVTKTDGESVSSDQASEAVAPSCSGLFARLVNRRKPDPHFGRHPSVLQLPGRRSAAGVLAIALTLALAGCGGQSPSLSVPPVPAPPVHAVDLPDMHDLSDWLTANPSGTVSVPAGQHRDAGGVRFSCPSGGSDCTVTVTDEGGTIAVTSTNGMASATPVHAVDLPDMHDLSDWLAANPSGTVGVPAGQHRDLGGVRFSCPTGGADCALTVTDEDGTIAATSTDGMASATPVHAVDLPDMHDLSVWLTANPSGTVAVPAGQHRDLGGVRFSCPAGGADCAVTVTREDGSVAATSTDGMASATPVHAVDLPDMHDLSVWLTANPSGTVAVPAGQHRDLGGVRFSCPAGGADCAVTVTREDGSVAATSTDGMASATPVHAVDLPDMHDLSVWLTANPSGTVAVPAGQHRDLGGVRFSCPAGGADCAVTVTREDGSVAATSTDGAASATPVHAVDLPDMHDLSVWLTANPSGTVAVPAGQHRDLGGVRFSCPAGGADCAVTVTREDGSVAATSTDGMASATPVHAVDLPDMHDLSVWLTANPSGTVAVPAGQHRDLGGVRFSCPAGGADCAVTVTREDGSVAATSTDGAASATPVHAVDLPDMHDLSVWLTANPSGTVAVPAGQHRDLGGVRFSCPAGGADCAVTVTREDGSVAATSTDGAASATPVHAVDLPDMHDLSVWLTANPSGTVAVPAGQHRDLGGVRFSCPAGGADCAVTVTREDGSVAATSTDGAASATPVHAVGLPGMHDLSGWLTANPSGAVAVPAGQHRDLGGVRFSCPAGGADCAVTVTHEDGTVAATSTDGMASAMSVPLNDRWANIYEIADTLLQSSVHLRYTFNWTGRGQSTSDHVVDNFSCTGSRCVGGGVVITAEDFRDPDNVRQVAVPEDNLGSHGGFDTYTAPADVDLSGLFAETTLTEYPSYDTYGAWGQYGALHLQVVDGPMAGQVQDVPFTGHLNYAVAFVLGNATGTNPQGTGSATWRGVAAALSTSTFQRGQGTATLTIADLSRPRVGVDVDIPGFAIGSPRWSDIPLTAGRFAIGTAGTDRLEGDFHGPDHYEAYGIFDTGDFVGGFGVNRTP